MAATNLSDVSDQIQEFWSPLFTKELRQKLLLGSLVDRKYQGDLKAMGDTVKVSQINAPDGALKTVGTDADTFSTETLSTTQIEIKADKRAVAAYEMEDLIQLQSQIGAQDSEIRASLLHAVEKQVNNHLYSLVAPSAATPDHTVTAVTDFNASQVSNLRKLGAQARWMRDRGWWILADPSYYNDMLNAQTLTSSDFVNGSPPVVGGQIVNQRFGWNILEDDSDGIQTLSAADSEDMALAFHPDFMHLVMQQEVRFKLSDLHSNKQFGFVLSVDLVFGAKLGIAGDVKHITVVNNV